MTQAPLTDGLGRPHTALRLSLTERCNLRCAYCMPEAGVPLTRNPALLTTPELLRLAAVFARAGVTKVRLTGGEPLVRKDAVAVAEGVGRLPEVDTLGITTNGLLLEDRLEALRAAGVTGFTLSLDTLRPDRFAALTRRPGLGRVLSALDAALDLAARDPAVTVKLNAVLLRGVNDDEAVDLAALAVDRPLEVRFIEVMPFDGNRWEREALVPMAETRAAVEARLGPLEAAGGYGAGDPSATARTFAREGWAGRVGFVASMTAPFCAGCNRLRLTADGALKVCLFGTQEVSLRDALRAGATDAELADLIAGALRRKHAAHAGLDTLADEASANRPMVAIGG